MIEGFDFELDTTGELIVDADTHMINTLEEDDLRVQMAFHRIKSISNTWFIDKIGANMEELIGKPINNDITNIGKDKIIEALTYDDLWKSEDIYIHAEVTDALHINYSVYLKVYTSETKEESSREIIVTLDLIKGVKIKYGWQ